MYAAKIIEAGKLSNQDRTDLQNEIFVLQHLKKHKNTITLFDFFQDSKRIYLRTEYALGGELFDRNASKEVYTEIEARNACKSLLSILSTP
jgi:calcium-dependent protein kinase